MNTFLAIFRAQGRIFLRNPLDIFVTVVLPLALVLLFGFIWGGTERPLRVGAVLAGEGEVFLFALSEFPEMAPKIYPDKRTLAEAVAKREVDFGLVWNGTELLVLLERSRIQDNSTFEGKARALARALEFRLAGLAAPLAVAKVHVGKLSASNWFHYIVPGLMAMSILQAGVFAVAGRIAGMRERGILRRMLVTPIPGWAILSGVGLLRMLVGFFSAVATFFLARFVFNVAFSVDGLLLLFYALAAGVGAMGLGAAVSLLAKRPGSANILGMILVQMMLFLSGIYIPFEFLPAGLRFLGQILPAYYLAQGFRAALGVIEGNLVTLLAALGFGLFGLMAFLGFGRLVVRPE